MIGVGGVVVTEDFAGEGRRGYDDGELGSEAKVVDWTVGGCEAGEIVEFWFDKG